MNLREAIGMYIKEARIGHLWLTEEWETSPDVSLTIKAQEAVLKGVEAILEEHDAEEDAMLEDMAQEEEKYQEAIRKARENSE